MSYCRNGKNLVRSQMSQKNLVFIKDEGYSYRYEEMANTNDSSINALD